MKNISRLACLSLFFLCWTSVPSRQHMLYGNPEGPELPLTLGEPPAVKVPLLTQPDPPAPIVTVKVRVPACIVPGQNLEYRIFVENCSPCPAHHVIVRNALPANARFVRASPEPHRSDPELQWLLGTLQGHGRCEITLILAPTGPDDVTNCTRIQYEHGQCVTTRLAGSAPGQPPRVVPLPGTGEPPFKEPKKGPTTKEPPLVGAAKLKVVVTGPQKQNVNQPARYSITVLNQGQSSATNVLIDSVLSNKLVLDKASDGGAFLAGTVAWLLGNLDPGASKTVELVVKAKATGEHCIRTRVLADGGVSAETESCTSFVGAPPSALLLEMYDRDDPVPLGGTTSYPIYVQNQGQVPVTNLRIQADLPDGMDLARARGPVDHKSVGKTVQFEPLPTLDPGARVEYEVFTRALAVGDLRFRIQMTADQLKEGGPVHEEESTTVYDEDAPPVRMLMQSRSRRPRIILLDQ